MTTRRGLSSPFWAARRSRTRSGSSPICSIRLALTRCSSAAAWRTRSSKRRAWQIGKSLVEADKVTTAQRVVGRARTARRSRLAGGRDHRRQAFSQRGQHPHHQLLMAMALNLCRMVGRSTTSDRRSVQFYKDKLAGAKTVIWNGPMGVFELEPFAAGTRAIAAALANATDAGAITIIGGGDSVAAVGTGRFRQPYQPHQYRRRRIARIFGRARPARCGRVAGRLAAASCVALHPSRYIFIDS